MPDQKESHSPRISRSVRVRRSGVAGESAQTWSPELPPAKFARLGWVGCSPCRVEQFQVRLSYHSDQDFDQRTGCRPQPYPPQAKPPARRFAGGKNRRTAHCPNATETPSANRAHCSRCDDGSPGAQLRARCTEADQYTGP